MKPELFAFVLSLLGDYTVCVLCFHWVIIGAMIFPGGRSECWKNWLDHRHFRNAWGHDLRHLAG